MKKIFILIVLFNVAVFKINAQFIVNDPTSIAQRLFLAVEEMTALIENKYQLVEQVQQMKQIYDQGQEVRDAVQKVASYVKKANEIIEIIEIGEATVADAKRYRREIKNMSNLTDSYKYEAFCLMVNFDTQIVNIINEAKTIISDKGSDTNSDRKNVV